LPKIGRFCKNLACSHFGPKRPLFRDPSPLFMKVAPAPPQKEGSADEKPSSFLTRNHLAKFLRHFSEKSSGLPYLCRNFADPLPRKLQNMETSNAQILKLELLWWLLTFLIAVIIMAPIYFYIDDYRFWNLSILFIFAFVTITRYIFLLKTTFLAKLQVLKIALVFVVIPVIFMFIQELNRYQVILDNSEPEYIVGLLPQKTMYAMLQYTRSVMLLFGVGSIISLIVLPFRLIISVWRYRNLGKA
jgi:hypothetical protein